jgi:hypothetical protein
MSEAKRYLIQKTPIGTMMKPNPEGNWVTSEDFDRVTAERDALQVLLTAADERADVLETALKKISARCVAYIEAEREIPEPSVEVCQMIASAALKPAECCTVSAEEQALLDAGDYTPEELFGIGGKPSCPKCAR